MHGKKLHQLPHSHSAVKFLSDGQSFLPGNPGNFRQPGRFPLHNLQGLIPEMPDNPGGGYRADAFDHAPGKIAQNFRFGLGHQPLQKFRLELPPVAGMTSPFSRHHQPLADGWERNGAHYGDRLPAAYRKPQDCVAVIVILIYHSANGALDNLHFLLVQTVLS